MVASVKVLLLTLVTSWWIYKQTSTGFKGNSENKRPRDMSSVGYSLGTREWWATPFYTTFFG